MGIRKFTSILTFGGETVGAVASANVEEFFCETNSWSSNASMPETREEQAGGLLPNGTIIISHGFITAPPNTTNTARIYDPLSDTWSNAANAAVARGSVGGDMLNGLFYVVGGTDSANNILDTVEIYDPHTNTWSLGTPLLSPRTQLAAVSLNGLLYAIGGFNGSNELSTNEVFNPLTNTWTALAPLPQPLAFLSAVTFTGKIYVFGGRGPGFTPSNTVYIYDPATNSWTSGASMPTARALFPCISLSM
ncbi:kelch repeat-containing protein [Neobacillus niacini]|uniref:Kelch repeat-containing protein n=1 Tax=Neobacillus niacini TaxID=86668 RepID=UPI00300238D6